MKSFLVFFCVACGAIEAQQAVFQSETRVVLVDAVVTGKKGEYVRDLTAKDFRVWEDNKEQTIKSFSLETDSSAEPRRLVLFFDNTGMSVTDQAGARQAAASFIDANLSDAKPGDANRLMAVVTFDGEFHVLESFTGNAGRLTEAVRGMKLAASSPANPRPVNPVDSADARALISSVANLAKNLNAVPGRKIIVLFSGGASFAAAQPADVASLVQIGNHSNVAVYPVMQGAAVQGTPEAAFDLEQRQPQGTYPSPNHIQGNGNAAAYPGSRPGDSIPLAIASGTGGFVLSGSNDVLAQLQKIGAEQNQSYVLGYTPPDSKEGACHTLRVKVDRGGAGVRVRSSYCTAKPQDLLAESRVEQDLEKRAAGESSGQASGVAAAIQAPFFYAGPNVARVHVSMEIATDGLKFENQKGKLHAEMNLLGIASSPDGGVAARFSDIVKRDLASKQDLEKSLHYEKEFKIVPGQYNLTVAFSSGGASFGKVETPLTVPAYDRSQLAISGLALSKEARPASELGLAASLIDDGTPLIAGGSQLIPTGSNVFTKSEQAFCYFEVYTPDAADPASASLRILDGKTGAQKWDGGRVKLDPPAGGKSMIPAGVSLPVASLPPGSYRLEITATDGADKTAKRTVDFEITGR